MSDLLSRLKLGTRATKLVLWPGDTEHVLLRILSQTQRQEATFATEQLFKSAKIELNMVTASEYESEQATQMLYRAVRDPAAPDEPVCPNITEFRKALTADTKRILLDEYVAFEKDISPSPDNLSSEEFDKILSDLKKNPSQTLSNISSISTLKRLCVTMANQPVTLPKVSGSSSRQSKQA